MRATIQKLNMALLYCEAASNNDILFVFQPSSAGLHIGDVIEFDPHALEAQQTALNLTTETAFTLQIRKNDVHDLRLSAIHSSSHFPSLDRLSSF